jgi:HemY protein
MIRTAFALFLVAAVAITVLALTRDPGQARLVWQHWQVDMTAAAAMLLTLFGALLATLFWRAVIWVLEAPRRAARARADQQRVRGHEALARGFLAAAAGDGSEARRQAMLAADLATETPALARILAAQAAEAAADTAAARAAYTAMLGFPEMRLAGQRGLMQLAQAEGDRSAALTHARAAYHLAKTARWAWRALFEERLEAGDWAAALDLIQEAQERKIVSPVMADRARAALLAASAFSLQAQANAPRDQQQALEFAQQSVKLQPAFAPGVVMAARLIAQDGKPARAAALIETAWKSRPHPALSLAYRDLVTAETPRERARRLLALAALNPAARESQILTVEAALIGGDLAAARLAAQAVDAGAPSQRLAGLMARVAFAGKNTDEARAWIARGAAAPQEADWSDIDPEGRAFNYTREDWTRLVSTYAETGELIHPRHERREKTISELPQLPAAYAESAPFITAAGPDPLAPPLPDDPGVSEAYRPPSPAEPPPAAPRRGAGTRRRLTATRQPKP